MKSLARQFVLLLPLCVIFVALAAHAQSTPCTGSSSGCLNSPLSGTLNSIPKFLAAVLSAIAKIGLPIITVYFVISGYLFIAAQGRPEPLNVAKRNLLYCIIGAVMVLSAWELANIIGSTVSQVVGS